MCALQGSAGLGTKSDKAMALKPQAHREAVLTPQQEIDILGVLLPYQPSAQAHLKRCKDLTKAQCGPGVGGRNMELT